MGFSLGIPLGHSSGVLKSKDGDVALVCRGGKHTGPISCFTFNPFTNEWTRKAGRVKDQHGTGAAGSAYPGLGLVLTFHGRTVSTAGGDGFRVEYPWRRNDSYDHCQVTVASEEAIMIFGGGPNSRERQAQKLSLKGVKQNIKVTNEQIEMLPTSNWIRDVLAATSQHALHTWAGTCLRTGTARISDCCRGRQGRPPRLHIKPQPEDLEKRRETYYSKFHKAYTNLLILL